MDNHKSIQNINYHIRHLLSFNLADPLSAESRGNTVYTQYFSGTGAASQINYLERVPTAAGRFQVFVSDVEKTINTDYTLNRSTGRITWTGTTPASSSDNIRVEYQAKKPWIYTDHPAMTSAYFPRITVEADAAVHSAPGMGIYNSYTTGIGERITIPVKIIVRHRQNNEFYTLSSIHYKNMDLVDAISDAIVTYFNSNKSPMPWKFFYWNILSSERNRSEEDFGIFRRDTTLEVEYFHNDV